ncbi:hypothetical protein T06_16846, partial [Trichinella sp. T6]
MCRVYHGIRYSVSRRCNKTTHHSSYGECNSPEHE